MRKDEHSTEVEDLDSKVLEMQRAANKYAPILLEAARLLTGSCPAHVFAAAHVVMTSIRDYIDTSLKIDEATPESIIRGRALADAFLERSKDFMEKEGKRINDAAIAAYNDRVAKEKNVKISQN